MKNKITHVRELIEITHVIDIDLPLVHKFNEYFDVWEFDVTHYYYWILLLVLRQYCVEVCATRTQDNLKKENIKNIIQSYLYKSMDSFCMQCWEWIWMNEKGDEKDVSSEKRSLENVKIVGLQCFHSEATVEIWMILKK